MNEPSDTNNKPCPLCASRRGQEELSQAWSVDNVFAKCLDQEAVVYRLVELVLDSSGVQRSHVDWDRAFGSARAALARLRRLRRRDVQRAVDTRSSELARLARARKAAT
ncbi:hypothetical protein QEN35_19665 [Gordonia alkanivorans]|uniref:hypothetical protein n=1 Tax=Gordonia alkanivorans TaxID=84096 RepID=UPI00244C9DD9|nr:hypothetical protein [Gordonia alkanivorans]MDH3026578.1 hypothetical protein [Gordonia alkanivorans]MDH3050770.1 hypothetical protein [Gordonia alkanivorans]